MNLEALLKDTGELRSPLDVSAFVLVQALKSIDSPQAEQIEALFKASIPRVSDEDTELLSQVLMHHLAEALAHGAYYGTVQLAGSLTMVEAHILHDALKQSGVANRIRHDHQTGNSFPNLGNDVEIWVYPNDLERARAIYQQTQATDASTVTCSNCGEENPGHFGRCWNCGSTLSND
ncbi:MAG: putative signal transducing protein [Bradymonadia bacterium]